MCTVFEQEYMNPTKDCMIKYIFYSLLFASFVVAQPVPFSRGVNITNWFQADSAKQIQFTLYTKKDFEELKSLGVDVVRLPINLHSMTTQAPDYKLQPLFLFFLDQVVNWAEELQINLILDNHTFDVTASTDTAIGQVLVPVWMHMAEHFKNRSTKILYEVLNEPHGISDAQWNRIQQSVVAAIRTVDQTHTIIVGPANWNSYNNLTVMPAYKDTNLIYTFHFYDPFLFTHQGADWTDLGPLSGVPFPYNANRMPVLPPALAGTWVASSFANYRFDGTMQQVQNWLTIVLNFQKSRNVPLFCGEFGVYMLNSPDTDRVSWYQGVRTYLQQNNIPWTIWDYRGGFGLYKKNSDELFQHDLNIPLVSALGFFVPAQSVYVQRPDTTSFELYSDYLGPNMNNSSYTAGTLDFYNDQNTYDGKYCISWNGADQYQQIGFDFKPNKDLSLLKDAGYVFDCRVKGDAANTSFDIRFVDTKTNDPQDHPWRMRYIITPSLVTFNNTWQRLQIPLKNFSEHGSWDNSTWYNPQGLFDWKNIDRFEIVSEQMKLTANKLWFDDIKIINPNAVSSAENKILPSTFELDQNFPNPFNPSTTIRYHVPLKSFVTLTLYDLLGREIAVLVNQVIEAGSQEIYFNGTNLPTGVYFYRLTAGSYTSVKKMILVR
jgi:endoglucanase